MKIGITEQGDACLDLSWTNKINLMDGAIIISKTFSPTFNENLLKYKDSIIYHATITGLGSSIIEPNVPSDLMVILNIENLIFNGFPKEHIVVRIDPILSKGIFKQLQAKYHNLKSYGEIISDIIETTYKIGIRRFRYSFIDLYKHVQIRFKEKNINPIEFENNEYSEWTNFFFDYENKYKDIIFESCAENRAPFYHKVGCVSKRDFEILGIKNYEDNKFGFQRKDCLCNSAKTELLKNKFRCSNQCLYCYWKD